MKIMNIKNAKIAGAIFLGATIGASIALNISHYSWWIRLLIGVPVGGLIGYLAYDFEEVWKTAKEVWKKVQAPAVWSWDSPRLKNSMEECTAYLIAHLMAFLVMCFLCGGVVLGFISVLTGINLVIPLPFSLVDVSTVAFIELHPYLFYLGGTLYMSVVSWVLYYIFTPKKTGEWGPFILGIVTAPSIFPVCLILIPVVVVYYLAMFLWFLRKIAWRTFRIIHSDLRLLCMTDAAIGTLVGYFTDNPILGGVIGATFGLLNYHVISIRLLKLAPQ